MASNSSRNDFSITKSFFASIDRNYPTVMDSMYELDESDVWNSPDSESPPACSLFDAASQTTTMRLRSPASVPVDVPDWSKILKDGKNRTSASERQRRRRRRRRDVEVEEEEEDGVPPHMMAAIGWGKSGGVAYSVCEGVGRDLSKVRNVIWEMTGFQG